MTTYLKFNKYMIIALGLFSCMSLKADTDFSMRHSEHRRAFNSAYIDAMHLRQDGAPIYARSSMNIVDQDGTPVYSTEFASESALRDRAYSISVQFMGTLDVGSKIVPATGADVYAISVVDSYDGRIHTNHSAVVYQSEATVVYTGPYLNVMIGPDLQSIKERQHSWFRQKRLSQICQQPKHDYRNVLPGGAIIEISEDGMVSLITNKTRLWDIIQLLLRSANARIDFDNTDDRFNDEITIAVENMDWKNILTGLLDKHGMALTRDDNTGDFFIK